MHGRRDGSNAGTHGLPRKNYRPLRPGAAKHRCGEAINYVRAEWIRICERRMGGGGGGEYLKLTKAMREIAGYQLVLLLVLFVSPVAGFQERRACML